MKKILALAALYFCVGWCFGQSTLVTATVTDSNGQTWNNGSYNIYFIPPPNNHATPQWQGADLPDSQKSFVGSLSPTGGLSLGLPSSTAITPAGSIWAFTICPNASSQCGTLRTPVTGGTVDISSALTAIIPPVNVSAPLVPRAYSDAEVSAPPPGQGGLYLNVTSNQPRYWDGAAWHPIGGSGSGTVNPGNPNCPFSFYPSIASVVSPGGVTVDCATQSSVTIPKGLFVNTDTYSNPHIVGSFTQQIPTYLYNNNNGFAGTPAFFATSQEDLRVNGTAQFPLFGINSTMGGDWSSKFTHVYINSPLDGGGYTNKYVQANSDGDTVMKTQYAISHGIRVGFEEGLEDDCRCFSGFNMNSFGGPATFLGNDPVGRAKIQVAVGPTYGAGDAGVDNTLINLSKVRAPTGNITGVTPYSDPKFVTVSVDSTLNTSLSSFMTGGFHSASVVAGADGQKYNASCPSIVIGSYPTNTSPYFTNWVGAGGLTTAQCITVSGDTSTLTNGSSIGIWGNVGNWEITTVMTKVDATHLIVPLNYPHDAGELITWGAGVGYGLSSPSSTIPARLLDMAINFQYGDLHLTDPIVGFDSTTNKVILWADATVSTAEVKLNIYGGTTPLVSGVYTPTVVGGVVTAVASNANNYISAVGISTILIYFPPPTLTLGGSFACAVPPVFNFTRTGTGGYTYQLNVTSGGSGCPPDLSITPQATYANPALIYPITRLYRVQDPITKRDDTGYVLADVLAHPGDWVNGDTVETVPNPSQYVSGNQQHGASPFVRNSGRFGTAKTNGFIYPQDGIDLEYQTNQTPWWYYYGDSTTNYLPSSVPAKAYYAVGIPPVNKGVGGAYSGGIFFRTPPILGQANTQGGYLFKVSCQQEGADGAASDPLVPPPCLRPVNPIFPKFTFLEVTNNIIDTTFSVDLKNPAGPTWDFTNRLTNGGVTLCKSSGVDCPTSLDYTMKVSAVGTFVSGGHYYLGDPPAIIDGSVSSISGVGFRVPKTCSIDHIYTSENVATGAAPTGPGSDNVQFTLYNVTTATILVMDNFSWDPAGQNSHLNTTGGIPVSTGDILRIQLDTPTWTTAPTGTIAFSAEVYCK